MDFKMIVIVCLIIIILVMAVEMGVVVKLYHDITVSEHRMVTEQRTVLAPESMPASPVKFEGYPLTDKERRLIECVVYAEIGNGTMREQQSVAQVILDRVTEWNLSVAEVVYADGQFAPPSAHVIPDTTHLAVSSVFDLGFRMYPEVTTHFYQYHKVYPEWAETKVMRGMDRYHVFMGDTPNT